MEESRIRNTFSKQTAVAALLLIMTMMGGWISFCSQELVLRELRLKRRIDFTKTIATGRLLTLPTRLDCTPSAGRMVSVLRTTTTTALMTFSAPTSDKIVYTATMGMAPSLT